MAKKINPESRDSANKRTLNSPAGQSGGAQNPAAPQVANPPSAGQQNAPSDRAGQFTGRGASGLQKK
jgi:hypothetical protein